MVKYVGENDTHVEAQAAAAAETVNVNQNTTKAAPAADYSAGNHVDSFDQAFDWSSSSSSANDFVRLLKEAAEKNEYLSRFRYGLVKGISAEMGSAAYVAGELNGAWLYGLVFFEKGQSIRIYETTNRQEDYFTLSSLINKDVLAKVSESIREDHGIDNVHYMITNCVPDFSGNVVDINWAKSLMGQLLLGVFGRAVGYLGTIVLKKTDRFVANVATPETGVATDVNGHPNRADIAVYVEHTPTNQESDTPTLLSDSIPTAYPPVRSCGYPNLRFTGLKKAVDGVQDLKQLQGEVVVSLIDSQAKGSKAPLERQFIAFGAFADIAQNGGWRDLYINTLNKQDRKFSALASHLSWGAEQAPDLGKLDSSRELVDRALRVFAPSSAALVVRHRAGNGVGGLSNMFAEIALRNTNTLGQLLNVLNSMFGDVDGVNFTTYLGQQLGVSTITCAHIVAAAVPTLDGVYTSTAAHRSLQDMDLTSVATHLGDKQQEMYRYMHAQSYANRELEGHAQRIYLAKLASAMYGNRSLRFTGESLDMAIHPVFARCVLDKLRQKASFQVNGVNANNELDNSLFYNQGGETFVLSGNGQTGGIDTFGLGVTLTDYKL
ncbi:hypothetical protein pSALSNUABM04_029 [Salmonella phage pSal-SNUABM-04]|nr:hypothetical protein pSALSNUABM04_029 [Salmonella phage pSal-SNUABM-04]